VRGRSGGISLKLDRSNIIIFGIILGLNLALPNTPTFAQANQETLTYTVKPGDYLVLIAINFGSPNFWEPIFKANKDKISTPDIIYPGQKLVIPLRVIQSDKFADQQAVQKVTKPTELSSNEKEQLEAFREAFNKLAKPNSIQNESKKEKIRANYNGLEFGGLVINETRSKMGSDFFNVFYKYWDAPQGTGNFILKISEQPIPSMGTLVSVKIDDYPVFKSRLQPRYEIIENLAKQAVMVSYQRLQQQINNTNELTTY